MAEIYGFGPPWIGGPQNVLSRQEDERLVKNDILQILFTEPGERVMRPTFGVPLKSFVFHSATDDDLSILSGQIAEAISTYEPRVIINLVTVTKSGDHGLNIQITVTMKSNPQTQLVIEQFIAGN